MSIEKAYNSWASIYDTNENKTRDLDAKITRHILSKYTFETVLELGGGTGKNTIFLLEKANQIISLDFSEEMLKKAKEKINSSKVEFRCADFNKDWVVEDNFADLITASLCLEHIENLNLIFEKANRKLKNRGYFFISELHPFKQYLGSKASYETEEGVKELEVFVHHITEYTHCAQKNGFQLLVMNEWFDKPNNEGVPRIISFVFQKE